MHRASLRKASLTFNYGSNDLSGSLEFGVDSPTHTHTHTHTHKPHPAPEDLDSKVRRNGVGMEWGNHVAASESHRMQ